jgi:hypothetical protein
MSVLSDLSGYITKRVISRDLAEADGTYEDWPELEIELSRMHTAVLSAWAKQEGVELDDLIVAIVTSAAVRVFREMLDDLVA